MIFISHNKFLGRYFSSPSTDEIPEVQVRKRTDLHSKYSLVYVGFVPWDPPTSTSQAGIFMRVFCPPLWKGLMELVICRYWVGLRPGLSCLWGTRAVILLVHKEAAFVPSSHNSISQSSNQKQWRTERKPRQDKISHQSRGLVYDGKEVNIC